MQQHLHYSKLNMSQICSIAIFCPISVILLADFIPVCLLLCMWRKKLFHVVSYAERRGHAINHISVWRGFIASFLVIMTMHLPYNKSYFKIFCCALLEMCLLMYVYMSESIPRFKLLNLPNNNIHFPVCVECVLLLV